MDKGKPFGLWVVSFLLSHLQYPFFFGLYSLLQGKGLNLLLLAVGIIPYLIGVLVITPWIGSAFAAAYDSLSKGEKTEGTKQTSPLIYLD